MRQAGGIAAGVGSGGQRGRGRSDLLSWDEPLANNQNNKATSAADEDLARRAHHLKIAAAVSKSPNCVQQQLSSNPDDHYEDAASIAAKRKAAFLSGSEVPVSDANRIGEGGYAFVRLERGLAIKTYDPSLSSGDPAAATHMQNELALAGRLRHPNIIGPGAVRRLGGGCIEIEMAYATGGSLAEYLKRAKYASRTPLPEAECAALCRGLVDAVCYLHQNGIAHGDLKLSNAMLQEGERGSVHVALIDFGTATMGVTGGGGPPQAGTLVYMSPEALSGAPYDAKAADVWSLGILLVNLLSRGEFPFGGRDEEALAQAVRSARPKLPAGLSEQCLSLIEGMLCKEPKRRMTVEAVRRHPWLANVTAKESKDPMVAADLSAHFAHLKR